MDNNSGAKRVRTGCATCRARKVKCDETKPSCLRCKHADRHCEGYPDVPARAKRKDAGVPRRFHTAEFALDISDLEDVNRRQMKADQPVETAGHASDILASLCAKLPVAAGILPHEKQWMQMVLKMAESEPCVLHALESLSSFVSQDEMSDTDATLIRDQKDTMSAYLAGLDQYNKSIRDLAKRHNQEEVVNESVMLVCSMIFCAIEFMGKQLPEALFHFYWALRLLRLHLSDHKVQQRAFLDSTAVHTVLVPFFRLARRDLLAQGHSTVQMFDFLTDIDQTASYPFPPGFDHLEAAHIRLTAIDNDILGSYCQSTGLDKLAPKIPDIGETSHESRANMPLPTLINSWRNDLSCWCKGYAQLESPILKSPEKGLKEKVLLQSLRLDQMLAGIRVTRIEKASEMAFDEHLEDFSSAIHLASNLMGQLLILAQANKDVSVLDAYNDLVSHRVDIIHSLWFIATKCRRRSIRHQALLMLSRWPLSEGFWSPEATAIAARCVIEEEDKEALQDKSPDNMSPAIESRILASRFETRVDDQHGMKLTIWMLKLPNDTDSPRIVRKEA